MTNRLHSRLPIHPCTGYQFADRLDLEWQHLRRSRRSLRAARAWAVGMPDEHPLARVLADLGDLDQILDVTHRTTPAESGDAALLHLVALSRHDQLAGRVVVQRLLPGLVTASARYRSFADDIDPLELAVPAAWLAVLAYDVERRRHHVAPSLISDAVYQAFRRQLRQRSSSEEPRLPRSFTWIESVGSVDEPPTAFEELAAVMRDARGAGVPDHDIDLIRHLVREGSPGVVARQRNVTARTVRNHRDRAVARVRLAVAEAA